jgi:hypothetical protein
MYWVLKPLQIKTNVSLHRIHRFIVPAQNIVDTSSAVHELFVNLKQQRGGKGGRYPTEFGYTKVCGRYRI